MIHKFTTEELKQLLLTATTIGTDLTRENAFICECCLGPHLEFENIDTQIENEISNLIDGLIPKPKQRKPRRKKMTKEEILLQHLIVQGIENPHQLAKELANKSLNNNE